MASRILINLRYSARSFVRTPGMALALLFTIALGIGSNVSVLGFVRGLTRVDSPLSHVDRVVSIFGQAAHREPGPLSYQEYLSLKGRIDTFEWLAAARISRGAVTLAGQSSTVPVAAITSNLAVLLRLSLNEGVVISHRMWQSEYGAQASIVGDQIRIDGVDAGVGGVAPEWLEGLYRDRTVDVWMPLHEDALQGPDPAIRNFWVLGRLRPGVSSSQAQSAIEQNRAAGQMRVLPYSGMTPEMAAGIARVGTVLGFAAGAVFFVACANVASFLLGRAFTRSHETSLRIALGASRGQLSWELLSDSIVISIAGGAAGMLLAVWTSRVLPALLYEQDAERLVFAPDLFSIVAASAVCVGITVACGLIPVLVVPHDRPAMVLRREGAGPSKTIRRLRQGLVVAQMASCWVLVIATAVLFQGLRAALVSNAGHRIGQTLLASVQADPNVGIRYFQHVEETTKSTPGVSSIAWTGTLPGSQSTWQSFRIEPPHLPLREVKLDIASFTADSLGLFTLPPKAGRLFGLPEQTCRAAVVNEQAAAELFDRYTVGRSIHDPAGLPVQVIGVVVMRKSVATRSRRPTIYYDYTNQKGTPPDVITLVRFHAPIVSQLARTELDANVVSPNYFDNMGLRLIAGQGFAEYKRFGECRIGMINQEAADLYFGGKAVGAAVIDDRGRRTAIIGVVRSPQIGAFQRPVDPALYLPMAQDTLPRMTMIVRARSINSPMLANLRRTIESVPGHGPAPLLLKTLETHLNQTALAPLHIAAMIIGASATIALMLSVLGLFGAMNDAARQRRREIAVRIALGAQRRHVIFQVLKEGGRLAFAGILAGMLGSLLLSRLLTGIITADGSPPLWVWLGALLVLAAAVAIASVLPARRGLMVNPVMIMREDN